MNGPGTACSWKLLKADSVRILWLESQIAPNCELCGSNFWVTVLWLWDCVEKHINTFSVTCESEVHPTSNTSQDPPRCLSVDVAAPAMGAYWDGGLEVTGHLIIWFALKKFVKDHPSSTWFRRIFILGGIKKLSGVNGAWTSKRHNLTVKQVCGPRWVWRYQVPSIYACLRSVTCSFI